MNISTYVVRLITERQKMFTLMTARLIMNRRNFCEDENSSKFTFTNGFFSDFA